MKMLLTGLTVLMWAGNALNDSPQLRQFHQYFPSHQHRYQHFRKNQIGKSHHSAFSTNDRRRHQNVHSSHLSNQYSNPRQYSQESYRQQRRLPNSYIGSYQRKPILIQPGHEVPHDARNDRRHRQVPAFNYRGTRKIEQTPLKISKNNYYSKNGSLKDKQNSFLQTMTKKSGIDNMSSESNVVSTKVKVPPPSEPKTSGHKPKPQTIKSAQKTGKPVAKVPVERNYNSAPAAPKFIIKQAGPSQSYGWVGHGSYAPLNINNIFKAAGINTRWIPEIDPIFTTGLLYPSPSQPLSNDSHKKAKSTASSYGFPSISGVPSNKVKKSIANSEYNLSKEKKITKQLSFESPAVPPPYVTSELSAIPPTYVKPESPAIPPSNTKLEQPAVPPPYIGQKYIEPSSFTFNTKTVPEATNVQKSFSFRTTEKPTTIKAPSVSVNGSPTPSLGYIRPTTYKPAYVSSTSKPFSLVIDSSKSKLKGQSPKKKDEEVFYIFYENNKNPLEPIKTGIDLQKYIEEEIEKTKQKDIIKRPLPQRKSFKKHTAFKDPRYFDVPIKIEENGEGFTPPSAIRTIFVPQDNKASLPKIIDVDIGTSFGYNNKLKKSRFPSFSEVEKSSYNSPITSYDAPIAPSSKVLESEEKKSLRKIKKVKKEKLTKSEYQAPITEQYGARLGPKTAYEIIKR